MSSNEKLLEVYKNDAVCLYELLRKKKHSKLEAVVDFWGEGVVTILDLFRNKGTYYLVVYNDKSIIVNLHKGFLRSEIDVSEDINPSTKFSKMIVNGYIYEKFRTHKKCDILK